MKIVSAELQGRLKHWIRTLKNDLYQPIGEISWYACRTTEHLPYEQAKNLPFQSVEKGYTWGNTWEYCWFKGNVTLPEYAEGKRIVLNLNPSGESTLFVNDQAFGTYRADWVSEKHHYIEDNILTRSAKAGEQFEIMMEVYAGHYYPDAGGCATGPVLPGSYTDPLTEGARRTLGSCTYGIWNEDAYQLFMDVDTLAKLLLTLDDRTLRAAKISKALEQFSMIVDFEQDAEGRNASYRAAREALKPAMEATNGSTMPQFYGVGNAHLDLAWLWPMAETHRKTARTFAAQLRLIEEYPEYKFIQSQPASYEMCKQHYPELFERIKKAVKGGQWIADGAMWVEPDTNMASGEALVRQLVHGKRYYKEEFDVDSKVLWLPDTFGYTAALPQILKSCGVDYLVTQKIFWSYNDGDQFPYHYFTWEGMDGSKVVSFLPTSYTYRTDPKQINEIWQNRSQVQDLDSFLLPFGYGDGGGGPSRDYIEYVKRQENLEGGVKVKMTSPQEFFEEMDAQGGPANRYVGELYFSAHRGVYTSQAMVKNKNRRSELALREAELWGALAKAKKGADYELKRADGLWKSLLLHQFHDILPGSSIARVYHEAETAFNNILTQAGEMTENAWAVLADKSSEQAVTVANSLCFERKCLVTVPATFANGAATLEGVAVPVGVVNGECKALVTVPAMGAVSIVPAAESASAPAVSLTQENGCFVLENSKVKAVVDGNGEVVSFVLKESGREFASAPMNHFRLYKDVPRLFDAWDIDSNYIDQELDAAFNVTVEPVCDGIEAVLKVTGCISESTFTQYIRLAADSTRVEFETDVDWKELHRLLKVEFPVEVFAENAINEMQFGYVERPTHRSKLYDKDRFEVCNHRYTALCDGAHGAAVLNDCKYGISVNDNAMQLTLLKSAASPEMRADNKLHHFTYAITAWEGTFVDCDVVKQGYELNVKPVVTAGAVDSFSTVSIDKANVILETVKPAEDGSSDIVLRLYEAKKAAVTADVALNLDVKKAYLCDMLENVIEEVPVVDGHIVLPFRAFEIKSIRLSV